MGGKAQKAKQAKLPNGEIGIGYHDANGSILATRAGSKKPWRNNNPGNLKGGSPSQLTSCQFAILTEHTDCSKNVPSPAQMRPETSDGTGRFLFRPADKADSSNRQGGGYSIRLNLHSWLHPEFPKKGLPA